MNLKCVVIFIVLHLLTANVNGRSFHKYSDLFFPDDERLMRLNDNPNRVTRPNFPTSTPRPTGSTTRSIMPSLINPTTPPPKFFECFDKCPATSEYNPICGNNQQLYFNEQKFNCAKICGAKVEILRRGSCAGLFPITRG